MTKKFRKSSIVLFSFLTCIILFYACRKELTNNEINKELNDSNQEIDISSAKSYYEQLNREQGDEVKAVRLDRILSTKAIKGKGITFKNRKYPIFKKAYKSETHLSTLVEIPMAYDERSSMVVSGLDPNIKASISEEREIFKYSFDRLVIYKNKKTGKINNRLVTYIPAVAYLKRHKYSIRHNHINNLDADFTGFLEYKKWDGTPLYLLQYVNGRRVRRVTLNQQINAQKINLTNRTTNSASNNTVTCSTIEIPIYDQSCINVGPDIDDPSQAECTDYIVGYITELVCDESPDDPCADYGDCDGDPCIDYGYCPGSGDPDNGVVVTLDENYAVLCGFYPTIKVGNGYTGSINGLGFTMTVHSSAGSTVIPVTLGASCFSVGGSGMNSALASAAIVGAYNVAVTEVMYMAKYGVVPLNSVAMRAALVTVISANMALLAGGSYSAGSCLGAVPSTNASFSCN